MFFYIFLRNYEKLGLINIVISRVSGCLPPTVYLNKACRALNHLYTLPSQHDMMEQQATSGQAKISCSKENALGIDRMER